MPEMTYLRQYICPLMMLKTPWSLTVHVANQAYKARKAFKVTEKRTDEFKEYYVAKHSWAGIKEVTDFLDIFSAATEG